MVNNPIKAPQWRGAKRRGTALWAVLLLAGVVPPATADGGYLSFNVGSVRYSEDDLDKTLSVSAQYLTAGWMMEERLGLELRIGKSGDKEVHEFGLPVTFSVPRMMGLYLRPVVPLNESVSLYASLGMARVTRRGTLDSGGYQTKVEEVDSSLSGGVGVQVALGSTLTLNAEYMSWLLAKDVTLHGITAGVGVRF